MIQTIQAVLSVLLVTVDAMRSPGCEPGRLPRGYKSSPRVWTAAMARGAHSHARRGQRAGQAPWQPS